MSVCLRGPGLVVAMAEVASPFRLTIEPSSHGRIKTEIQRAEDNLTILEVGLLGCSVRSDLESLSRNDLALRTSGKVYRLILRRHCWVCIR